MINTLWNATLMTTKNSATPWKHGKYSVHIDHTKKKHFVALQMSATGNRFTAVAFQIDTAATYNTLSKDALQADAKHGS